VRKLAVAGKIGGGASDPKAISVEGHKRQYEDFANAIRENRQPAIPGREGRKAVELITSIYQSSKSGRIVKL
jgi:predicted dehydrogenase